MSALLFSESTPELVDELGELEKLADACYEGLQILRFPKNVASWASLTRFVEILESTIHRLGTPYTPRFVAAIINIGRGGSLLIEWIQKHGAGKLAPQSQFKWHGALATASALGFDTAHNYESFTGCFPAWRRDRAAAEIRAPRTVRFTWAGGPFGRRVSAFQKGLSSERVQKVSGIPSSPVPDTPETRDQLARVLQACRRRGSLGFTYPEPIGYYEFLEPFYKQSLNSVFRREDSLSLGAYTLGAFKSFYVALLTICATREILCHWWGVRAHRYPLNSAVIVKDITEWVRLLGRLSSLSNDAVVTMLNDLTFPVQKPRRPFDLLVHPFIPLDRGSRILGLVPHLPLHSRPDENILRICSYVNPVAYGSASQLKEQEMRFDLVSQLPAHIVAGGPVLLPGGNPDLDLTLEDKSSSTLVLAELKWIRKPISVFERCDRDEDFLKGVNQLRCIEKFLSQNPRYLADRGKLSRSISEYSEVRYLLIARDHFVWVDPDKTYPVIEHDNFKRAMAETDTLHGALNQLLTFDWLPVEERDFTVKFETSRANGVSIESEIFHAPAKPML
jgi:hypothetical protein